MKGQTLKEMYRQSGLVLQQTSEVDQILLSGVKDCKISHNGGNLTCTASTQSILINWNKIIYMAQGA